jgi:glyoxylate reductase
MQPQPKVFVTRRIPAAGLAMLQAACHIRVWEKTTPPPPSVLHGEVADVDGLLCLHSDKIDAAVMNAAPKLRVVSTYAVGYDNIDIEVATQRGLPVGHTR